MIAICSGPWAAVIAVSVALLFQALLFGDGGVLAYGVNCFNMAVILPFVAYAVYRLLAGRAPLTDAGASSRPASAATSASTPRRCAAASSSASSRSCSTPPRRAALLAVPPVPDDPRDGAAAPDRGRRGRGDPDRRRGRVPAARQRRRCCAQPPGRAGDRRRRRRTPPAPAQPGSGRDRRSAVMALLTPLGLLAPGGAFGEDAPSDSTSASTGLDAVPSGLHKYNGFWSHTLLGGYGFADGEHPTLGYIAVGAGRHRGRSVRRLRGRRGSSRRLARRVAAAPRRRPTPSGPARA